MVTFNPETNPGQFGLTQKEMLLAASGLDSMILGPDQGPPDDDIEALCEWGRKTQERYLALMQQDTADPNILAARALRQASIDSHDDQLGGATTPIWMSNSFASTIMTALQVGVDFNEASSQRLRDGHPLKRRRSRAVNQPVADLAITQLRPIIGRK